MSYTVIADLFSDQDSYMQKKAAAYMDPYNNGTNQYRAKMYQDEQPMDHQYQKNILPRTKITNYAIPQTLHDESASNNDSLKQIIDKLSSMVVKETNSCNCSDELKEIKRKVDSSDIMLKGIILVLFILLVVVLLKK